MQMVTCSNHLSGNSGHNNYFFNCYIDLLIQKSNPGSNLDLNFFYKNKIILIKENIVYLLLNHQNKIQSNILENYIYDNHTEISSIKNKKNRNILNNTIRKNYKVEVLKQNQIKNKIEPVEVFFDQWYESRNNTSKKSRRLDSINFLLSLEYNSCCVLLYDKSKLIGVSVAVILKNNRAYGVINKADKNYKNISSFLLYLRGKELLDKYGISETDIGFASSLGEKYFKENNCNKIKKIKYNYFFLEQKHTNNIIFELL